MKSIVRECEFTTEQTQEIKTLAAKVKMSETAVGIAYARGATDEEKLSAFLSPSKSHLAPPEKMRGMNEAKALIARAKEEEWSVAVFGDYDADGIGACSILSRALKEYGIEPYLYIPERADGYGLSVEAVDFIFDECLPDLFITVDCGISCHDEVEYIKQSGAYVIVTDHHELPDVLPDCVCVNPKFEEGTPYDSLCGAGVAFKLAFALIGEKAYDLLDICALSTVADSVPLIGENRDIVAEGLKLINKRPRPAFSALLGKTDEVTSRTLAFTLAPRVNAAGRMGDAKSALKLFTSENEEEISLLAEKLSLYNAERQKLCDELYNAAREQIKANGAYQNVVMAYGEDWNVGLVGIVAARVAEEFSRPALLFVKNGDMMRGSARSVEGVNIFEALKSCSSLIEEFGGHSQAAGVNIKAENFRPLSAALDAFLQENYSEEDFSPVYHVAFCGRVENYERLTRELERFEPFGVGNKRPLFAEEFSSVNAERMKPLSPHISVKGEDCDFAYFNGEKKLKLLKSKISKTFVFEYQRSLFRGREYIKGYVRAVISGEADGGDLYLLENALRACKNDGGNAEKHSQEEIGSLIAEKRKNCRYGLCVICYGNIPDLPSLEGLPRDVFFPSANGAQNVLLLSPDEDADLSAYRDIVCLENVCPNSNAQGNVYRNGERKLFEGETFFLPRERLLKAYAYIKGRGELKGETLAQIAGTYAPKEDMKESFLFALSVFEELGLAAYSSGCYRVVTGKKSDLNESRIFRAALQASGG